MNIAVRSISATQTIVRTVGIWFVKQIKIISCNEELNIVEEFLSKQMSDEELKKVVTELLDSEKPGDMGTAMEIVMGKYKDVADGKKVQALVKEMFFT